MPHPAPAQPRRKLTADLIPRAREMAAPGRTLALIADALSVHRGTLHRWRTEAGSEGLERDLCDAIEEGQREGVLRLLGQLREAAASDWRAAAWLLTHSPATREHFSDAGYERRAERQTLAVVIKAITAAGLTPDDQMRLLLQLEAHGLSGAVPGDDRPALGPSDDPPA